VVAPPAEAQRAACEALHACCFDAQSKGRHTPSERRNDGFLSAAPASP